MPDRRGSRRGRGGRALLAGSVAVVVAALALALLLERGQASRGGGAPRDAPPAPPPLKPPAHPPAVLWLEEPSVSVMTGFLHEPRSPQPTERWLEGLGSAFDADRWVREVQETGASHLVFYDKWIDGLVFHDTRTTSFKSRRDFVREITSASQRAGLPLVLYFNAIADGNPEFDTWALADRQGRPVLYDEVFPTRYQTLHSPYRAKALEQVRELLTGYGPLHGLWHDIFQERMETNSPHVAGAYRDLYGEPFAEATPGRLYDFEVRTLAGWLDEVAGLRARSGQKHCLLTANGSGTNVLWSGGWADHVGGRLDYLFNEGHGFAANDGYARMAWVLPKPLDVNLLLSSSWFTPPLDAPPPAAYSEKQAIAATAIAVCQGAGVTWALTPGHSGVFGEDLQRARAAGAWFRRVRPYLRGAQPHADVAVVLGAPPAGSNGLPGKNPFWEPIAGSPRSAWQAAVALADALADQGVHSRLLYDSAAGGSWPASLAGFGAVVLPEQAPLGEKQVRQIRDYVRGGGRLVAFGHASLLDEHSRARGDLALADVLGLRFDGQVLGLRQGAVSADSEFEPARGPHALQGGPGPGWSSAGTPMPHWLEVRLPRPVDVEWVEVANRPGPFQITDLRVEVPEGDGWRVAASAQGAVTREIAVPLLPPRRVERLRVVVLRELYEGAERLNADVASLRVVDSEGHDWVRPAEARPRLTVADRDLARVFGPSPSWPGRAVKVVPAGAEVVARFAAPEPTAALTRHAFGRGQAWLVAAGDADLLREDPLWPGIARLAAEEPSLTVRAEPTGRYRVVFTRAAGAHVVHVIDSRSELGRPAGAVTLSLSPRRLGPIREARLAETDQPLALVPGGGRLAVTVRPDPVATVVLR